MKNKKDQANVFSLLLFTSQHNDALLHTHFLGHHNDGGKAKTTTTKQLVKKWRISRTNVPHKKLLWVFGSGQVFTEKVFIDFCTAFPIIFYSTCTSVTIQLFPQKMWKPYLAFESEKCVYFKTCQLFSIPWPFCSRVFWDTIEPQCTKSAEFKTARTQRDFQGDGKVCKRLHK